MTIDRYVSNPTTGSRGLYRLSPDSGVEYSDGDRAEAYVSRVIRNSRDLSSDSTELQAYVRDWPSRYHLSRERSLAYRTLKISPTAAVLEVGSGTGAIARFLGETAGWVLALEGSPRRAAICRDRTRDLENVDVLCASFEDVTFSKTFDLVVCNGVFEYAALFMRTSDPFRRMLAMLSRLVAPGGALVIAIENQLGLRYFSSGKEEHTNLMFDGLEGYPARPNGPRTFGVVELTQMLRHHFTTIQTLIPLPDYKLPTALVRDDLLARVGCAELFANTARFDYGSRVAPRMHERLVWHELQKNSLLKTFANSLFLVAGNGGTALLEPNWMGRIYAIHRKAEWTVGTNIATSSDGTVFAEKSYLCPRRSRPTNLLFRHDCGREMWVEGHSVHTAVVRALCGRGIERLELRLRSPIVAWWNAIEKTSPSRNPDKVGGLALDRHWTNSILAQEGVRFVDREWTWTEDIDKLWLIYRVVAKFADDESPFIHRWNVTYRWSSFFRLVEAVSTILRVKISVPRLGRAVDMERVFQQAVTGTLPGRRHTMLGMLEPLRTRQLRKLCGTCPSLVRQPQPTGESNDDTTNRRAPARESLDTPPQGGEDFGL